MTYPGDKRFVFLHIWLPLLLAALVFVCFDLTDLDITISNALYNQDTKLFFWIDNQLVESVLHKGARNIPGMVAIMATFGALLSLGIPAYKRCLPNSKIPRLLELSGKYQLDLFYIWIAMAIGTGLFTHSLKTETGVFCPVQTTLYGGKMLYAKWWEFTQQTTGTAGNCWPGGHASGAFSLFVLYFVALRYRWRYATHVLFAVVILGLVFGTVRVLQGWHFMSHALWSGLYMWLASLITALLFYGDGNKSRRIFYTAMVFLVVFGSAYVNKLPGFSSLMAGAWQASMWRGVSRLVWAGDFIWLSLLGAGLAIHGRFREINRAGCQYSPACHQQRVHIPPGCASVLP